MGNEVNCQSLREKILNKARTEISDNQNIVIDIVFAMQIISYYKWF